jgi:hypothetical protein
MSRDTLVIVEPSLQTLAVDDASVVSITQETVSVVTVGTQGPAGAGGSGGGGDITGLVPYTGATSHVNLGAFNVTAASFIGALSGNASTATTLQTARTIGGVSFNGSANITVATATGGFTVSGGDAEITAASNGVIIKSPNGTRWRVQIDDNGALNTTSL